MKSPNKTLEEVEHRKEFYKKRYKNTTEMIDIYFLEFRAPKTTVWNTPKKLNWKSLWLSHWAVLAGRIDDFSCQALIISYSLQEDSWHDYVTLTKGVGPGHLALGQDAQGEMNNPYHKRFGWTFPGEDVSEAVHVFHGRIITAGFPLSFTSLFYPFPISNPAREEGGSGRLVGRGENRKEKMLKWKIFPSYCRLQIPA